jgi:hypothetical protein
MAVLTELSLVDLKKLAKDRRIKQYYIKKRAELLELLAMEELPFKFKQEKMTIRELRTMAKEQGFKGFWGLSRDELMKLLFAEPDGIQDGIHQGAADQQEENNSKAAKHENPEE